MSACRGSHDAYALRVDAPFGSMFAYEANGLFGIRKGDFIVAVGHAVLQYCVRNALCIEPGGHVESFVAHGKTAVSASPDT